MRPYDLIPKVMLPLAHLCYATELRQIWNLFGHSFRQFYRLDLPVMKNFFIDLLYFLFTLLLPEISLNFGKKRPSFYNFYVIFGKCQRPTSCKSVIFGQGKYIVHPKLFLSLIRLWCHITRQMSIKGGRSN